MRQTPRISLRTVLWAGIASFLVAVAIANAASEAVTWTAADFVVASVLLGSGALALEAAARRVDGAARLFGITAVILVVGTIWALLATGG
jgi:hypothetical protein